MAKLVSKGIICPVDDGYSVRLPDGDEVVQSSGIYIDGNNHKVHLHHAGKAHVAPPFTIPGDPAVLDDVAKGLRMAAKLLREGRGFVGRK